MRRLLILLALAASACGKDTPVAPTIIPATLIQQGTLIVNGCGTPSPTGVYSCSSYTGTVKNTGTGCASNVRGVTKTYVATTRAQVGSSEWFFSGRIRPNEEISYTGLVIAVPGPLTGGWAYTTEASWDNVSCS